MTPENAIEKLPELLKEINKLRAHLANEADSIVEQWEGLRRVGGQRADHAAQLLGMLRPHLDDLARFCTHCSTRITGYIADPFGRKQEGGDGANQTD